MTRRLWRTLHVFAVLTLGLLGTAARPVMSASEFAGDAEAVRAMLADESGVWKRVSGRLISIKKLSETILPSEDDSLKSETRVFELRAEDLDRYNGKPPRVCTLRVTVLTRRDKMATVGSPVVSPGDPVCVEPAGVTSNRHPPRP